MAWRCAAGLGLSVLLASTPFAAEAKRAARPTEAATTERSKAPLDATAINGADLSQGVPKRDDTRRARRETRPLAKLVKAQVLLDRAHLSPGAIDGRDGDNFRAALAAFAASAPGPVAKTGSTDAKAAAETGPEVWQRLAATSNDPVVQTYALTQADIDGPYVKRIPAKFEEQADLDAMGYTSVVEMLAERFHMSQALLRALNAGKRFDKAGETLLVAAVPPLAVPKQGIRGKPEDPVAKRVVVDKAAHRVQVFGELGESLGSYPASIGSKEKPAPSGTFKVFRVALDPTYTYNPKYHFKGVKARHKFTIAPGPNNPVGIVWIDLSAKSYGIHGTPNPETIGKSESHGCIRLTNWDALTVAEHVDKGAEVEFKD